MDVSATYYDGLVADPRPVTCRIEIVGEAGSIHIVDTKTARELTVWQLDRIAPIPARREDLRLSPTEGPAGARLIFSGRERSAEARKQLPVLAGFRRRARGAQLRIIALATAALASVVLVYLYGVPLLASRIVGLIPPQAEMRFGDQVVQQVADALEDEGGLKICDPNPDSRANRAIRRYTDAVLAGVDTPFHVDIQVVDNTIPNAFALPGGHAFYFSGLLENTETPDEFAAVMAHEIGHVVYRHGMQTIISSAGTGLLVGFILGDVTGISVMAGVGATLIDTSFSRQAERQADQFALETAQRLHFRPTALADLLDRVASDDSFSRALALLSTHPLTDERRARLDAVTTEQTSLKSAFSAEEWRAIKTMCGKLNAAKIKSKS